MGAAFCGAIFRAICGAICGARKKPKSTKILINRIILQNTFKQLVSCLNCKGEALKC